MNIIYDGIVEDLLSSITYDKICTLFSKSTTYEKAVELLNNNRTFCAAETCAKLDEIFDKIEN